MLDRLIRLVAGIKPVGTGQVVDIERYPMPRRGLQRCRRHRAVGIAAIVQPSPGIAIIDAFPGFAAHHKAAALHRVEQLRKVVDIRHAGFADAEPGGAAVTLDARWCAVTPAVIRLVASGPLVVRTVT